MSARRRIGSGSAYEAQAGYSRAVVQGDWCFVAGTTGADPATGAFPDDVVAQTEHVFAKIEDVLGDVTPVFHPAAIRDRPCCRA